MNLFSFVYPQFKFGKTINVIECFSGIGTQAIKNKPKFKVGDIVYANNFYPNEKLVITTVRDLVAEGYKNLDEGEKYEYDIKRPKGKEDTFFEKWLSYRSEE